MFGLALCLVLVAGTACSQDAPEAQPQTGGTFRIALANVDSFDPAVADSLEEQLLAEQLFESLTRWNPVSLEAEPAIASSWTVSDDQKVFDFALRTDLKFANGRVITADDVKYSLERVSRNDTASPLAEMLAPVTGFLPWHVDYVAGGMTGITVVSPTQLRITLDRPWSLLPSVLANPGFGVVPREAIETPATVADPAVTTSTIAPVSTTTFATAPVGSGAFAWESRGDDNVVRLTSRRQGVIKAPYVDGMTVQLVGDQQAGYQALVDGNVDWARVPTTQISDAVDEYGDEGVRSYVAVLYYGLNKNRPELADRRLREAIVKSIDRSAINRDDLAQTTQDIDGVVPTGIPGSQEDACDSKCAFDRAAAAALIADAFALVAPPAVFVDFDEDPLQTKIATRIKEGLDAVGVVATLRPHATADYATFVRTGETSLFRLGWVATYPHADAFLTPQFGTGQPDNVLGYSNADVDAALASGRSTSDIVARNEHFRRAESLLIQDFAVVPLAQYRVYAAATPNARGIAMTSMGLYDASTVWMR
jgi:ABC-type transport system substrate-binding protein